MLNTANKNIAEQISNIYCQTDAVCKAGVEARLNQFDNATFTSFLSTLQTKAYLFAWFINQGSVQTTSGLGIKTLFKYQDVISGGYGEAIKIIPHQWFIDNDMNRILFKFVDNGTVRWVKLLDDSSTGLITNSSYGYPISLTTTPTPGGGGSGSGGGTIVVTTQTQTPNGSVITQTPEKTGFDLSKIFGSDLSIVAIVGGIGTLYFVGKQMKWF